MNDILRAMREHALTDAAFRQAILATQNAADPLTADDSYEMFLLSL